MSQSMWVCQVGLRTPVRTSDFLVYTPVRTGPGAHPASFTNGCWGGARRSLDHPPPPNAEAIHLLSLCACVACYGETFTINSIISFDVQVIVDL
jgi:hypothetical protein